MLSGGVMSVFEFVKLIIPILTAKATWYQIVLSFVVIGVSYALYRKWFLKPRSCPDCLRILIPEIIKAQSKISSLIVKSVEEQMVFVEQKLNEISAKATGMYYGITDSSQKRDAVENRVQEYKYYMALSELSEYRIKSELRRALKENGFKNFVNEDDFQRYIKNKVDNILEIVHQVIQFFDPERALSMEKEIFSDTMVNRQLYAVVYDIFNQAKRISRETQKKIEQEQKFVNIFIHDRMNIKGY